MSIHHPDHQSYLPFTRRQRVDKAVFVLKGLLRGVAIDGELNAIEIAEVLNWRRDYSDLFNKEPFSELKIKLDQFLADGVIDPEEQEELVWVCANIGEGSSFYDEITHDIQRLHGILHGILADGVIRHEEATQLQSWIDESLHLKGTYPYDELDSLLTAVLKDGVIDEKEQRHLREFFEDFVQYSLTKRIGDEGKRIREGISVKTSLPGICSICPDIAFESKTFSFTGSSTKGKREDLIKEVVKRGGAFSPGVTQDTAYLVVGAAGNPCWAFSCYGRKVEKAVSYRKVGHPIVIVHESDFWDAVHDS